MPHAIFGITNDSVNLAVTLLVLFLIVLWVALVVWTFLDARRRLDDTFLVIIATLASLLLPFVGTIVYSILRPPEFLVDMKERELEIRASELRVRQLEEQSCQNCGFPIERTYLRCPNCKTRVKDPCTSCGKPVDPRWSLCPYCEQPVRRAAPQGRRRAPRPAAPGAPRRRKPAETGAPQKGESRKTAARSGSAQRAQRATKPQRAVQRKARPVADGDGLSSAPPTEGAAAKRPAAEGGEESPKPATK